MFPKRIFYHGMLIVGLSIYLGILSFLSDQFCFVIKSNLKGKFRNLLFMLQKIKECMSKLHQLQSLSAGNKPSVQEKAFRYLFL